MSQSDDYDSDKDLGVVEAKPDFINNKTLTAALAQYGVGI